MNNIPSIGASAPTQTVTLPRLSLLEQGERALRLARQQLQSHNEEETLRSLNVAKEIFSNALAQNRVLSYDEKRDIEAGLAQAYLESGDILRSFGRIEEARASYMAARSYGLQEAEQKLSSLPSSAQTSHEEGGETVIQMTVGVASQAVEGSGHVSNVHYIPTGRDLPLLAQAQRQQPSFNEVVAAASQLQAARGGRTVIHFTSGVANSTISGDHSTVTLTYGVGTAPAEISNPAIPGDIEHPSEESLPPPEGAMEQ